MNKHSLEIPLYLNQKIVFDLLASINDGFTQVTKLKTASSTEGNLGGTVEADLGNKCNQRAQTDGFAEQNGRDAERADLTCRY